MTRFTSGGRAKRGAEPHYENEILAAFRRNVGNPHPDDWYDLSPAGTADLWTYYITTENQDVSHDEAKVKHALEVITRYGNTVRSLTPEAEPTA